MSEPQYIAGETCYRPEPSKCYYGPCGQIGKCVKDIPDYDPRKSIDTYIGVSLNSIQHPEGDPAPDDHEIKPDSLVTVEIDIPMSINEINEAFDREYEKHIKDVVKEDFYKIKMPEYYIAKHSDEDLRAAVLAEREACAQLCLEQDEYGCGQYAKAIRARGEK